MGRFSGHSGRPEAPVEALQLVILPNVDRASFSRTNAGPLGGVKFNVILTVQDIGSYKPDLRNFEYMLDHAKRELGVDKAQILSTAESVP
jgi:FMN phosphatase YigB (HAD superfamily)